MTYLENLGFIPVGETGHYWSWDNTFTIYTVAPSVIGGYGKTGIFKNTSISFTGDNRENILYRGNYILDNEVFLNELLKNVGVLEKINGTKIIEKKNTNHQQILKDLGFSEVEANTWTKNIYLISLKAPRFDTDRGKCIILKKPNVKKLMKVDRPARVVYKGRYFFDDIFFTEALFDKIDFYNFDNGQKNKTYEFNRETIAETGLYIEEEFLKF